MLTLAGGVVPCELAARPDLDRNVDTTTGPVTGVTDWNVHEPLFVDGHLVMPDRPGWGTEPNEEAMRARPPKGRADILSYGTKK